MVQSASAMVSSIWCLTNSAKGTLGRSLEPGNRVEDGGIAAIGRAEHNVRAEPNVERVYGNGGGDKGSSLL